MAPTVVVGVAIVTGVAVVVVVVVVVMVVVVAPSRRGPPGRGAAGRPPRWPRPWFWSRWEPGRWWRSSRVRDAQRQSVQARAIEDVLSAPDAVLHTVAGPNGQGRVTVVVSQSRDQAVAVLGDLPAPGVDRAYQLWMLRDNQPTDKGLLAAGATGGTVLINGVRGEQRFAITNEPKQGSAAPTTPNPPVNFSLT